MGFVKNVVTLFIVSRMNYDAFNQEHSINHPIFLYIYVIYIYIKSVAIMVLLQINCGDCSLIIVLLSLLSFLNN